MNWSTTSPLLEFSPFKSVDVSSYSPCWQSKPLGHGPNIDAANKCIANIRQSLLFYCTPHHVVYVLLYIYIYILFRLVSARHIYPSVTPLSSHSLAVPRIASRDDYVLFHSKTISNQTRTPSLHLSYVPPFRFNVDIYPPRVPSKPSPGSPHIHANIK